MGVSAYKGPLKEKEGIESQRKMKVTIVLLAACVASLSAAGLRTDAAETTVSTESTTTTGQCPAHCCTTSPTQPTEPTKQPAETTTKQPAETTTKQPAETTTKQAVKSKTDAEPTAEPTVTTEECPVDCTCPADDPDSGAGSASLSLIALLLPAFFAHLL